jgi:hypothetical protein
MFYNAYRHGRRFGLCKGTVPILGGAGLSCREKVGRLPAYWAGGGALKRSEGESMKRRVWGAARLYRAGDNGDPT